MQILKKYFYKLYQLLKKHKNKVVMLITCTTVFFIVRFPYKEATQYLIMQITQKTNSLVQIKYEQFYVNPFNLSLVFKNVEIITKKNIPFKTQQLSIRLSYTSLLQLKMGYVLHFKWSDNSVANITVKNIHIKKNNYGWLVLLNMRNFTPSTLHAFYPILSKIKGAFNFNLKILVDPTFKTQPDGKWNLIGTKVESQSLSYTFPGSIGSISLPQFKWNKVNFDGILKNGEITISDLSIGDNTDALSVKTRGIVFANISRHSFSHRIIPRMDSYDIGLDIIISKNLYTKLYFLNTIFSAIETKTPTGWRYLGRIKGNAANFFDLSPIVQLPTLQDIKNPTKE